MVRPKDAKINALSRLIDAGIIGCTLVALVSVMQLDWLPVYSWLLLIAIVLFSFFTESSRTYKSWRDISISGEIFAVGSNWAAIVVIFLAIQYWLRLQSDIGPSIKVTTGQFENYFEIGLIGSATGANRRLLQDGCQKALDKPCTIIKHVRLNCAELDYIDSGSLGLLLNFKLQLSERGQTLSFFNMSDRIRTLMGLHGVQQFLLASQRR